MITGEIEATLDALELQISKNQIGIHALFVRMCEIVRDSSGNDTKPIGRVFLCADEILIGLPIDKNNPAWKNHALLFPRPMPALPGGHVMVPAEPTESMIDAMVAAQYGEGANLSGIRMQKRDEYVSAISASRQESAND